MISYDAIRPVIDRMFTKTATVEDFVQYIRFEMQEAMKVLPPEVSDDKSDGWHGSACCLRVCSSLLQMERLLEGQRRKLEHCSKHHMEAGD